MKKYAVSYTRIPTNYNPTESLVVEAGSPEDAIKIVRDHLRDLSDLSQYVYVVRDYVAPPAGRIVGRIV